MTTTPGAPSFLDRDREVDPPDLGQPALVAYRAATIASTDAMTGIRELLRRIGLEHYAERFEAVHVRVEDLLHLSDDDLSETFRIDRSTDRKHILSAARRDPGATPPPKFTVAAPESSGGAPGQDSTAQFVAAELAALLRGDRSVTVSTAIVETLPGAAPAKSANIVVDPLGGADATSIREAVAMAAPNAVIRLNPGTYRETVRLSSDLVIEGAVGGGAIVQYDSGPVVLVIGGKPVLRHLTIRSTSEGDAPESEANRAGSGEKARDHHAISVTGGDPHLEELDVSAAAGNGISVQGVDTRGRILACRIHDCGGCGIQLLDGTTTIEATESFANRGSGLALSGEARPLVLGCKFHDSLDGSGIVVLGTAKGSFENCDSFANKLRGLEVSGDADPTFRTCRFRESKECAGILLRGNSSGTFESCESFANHGAGIAVAGDANPSVRNCRFHDATHGDGIYVHGRGKGTFDNCQSFRNSYAGISVDDDANPIVRGCKFHNSRLSGVIVQDRGKGTFENCDSSENNGAGIEVRDDANPTVRGCEFHRSEAANGIEVYGNGTGTFENCESFYNREDGIEVGGDGNPTVRRCKFYGSNAFRGISIFENAKGTFEDCESFYNRSDGIAVSGDADPIVRRCKFYGSEELRGISIFENGKGTFEDCESFNNRGDGIAVSGDADPIVYGCKFYGSEELRGISVFENGKGTFEHCESFSNRTDGVAVGGNANPTLRGCKFYRSKEASGIVVYGDGSGTFKNCESFDNWADGIAIRGNANPTVLACRFFNSTDGCGILICEDGTGTFSNCESFANARAGILVTDRADPTARDCTFYGSKERDAISIRECAKGTFENCESFEKKQSGIEASGDAKKPIRLLQLNQIELRDEISHELESNPILEDELTDSRRTNARADATAIAITPDVYVTKEHDRWVVTVNDEGMQRLYVNDQLAKKMLSDKTAEKFVGEKLRNAQWLIRALEQRRRTIIRVTEAIVARQEAFFEKGVAHLNPMLLRDIAKEVEILESTISRITTNKYAHTPQGLFELKYFFNWPKALSIPPSDQHVSREAVKQAIKKLIENEDKSSPLSDLTIVERVGKLSKGAVPITRRTVVKCRNELGIPTAGKRRTRL